VPRRIQIVLLSALLLLLGYMAYRNLWPSEVSSAISTTSQQFVPLAVEDPSLRLDLLDRLKQFQYHGSQRNIFSATVPPPPAPAVSAAKQVAPAPPPGPPPLIVPAKFFGYVTDARTGTRRAFFSEGDNVYILGVGELLLGRFRLLQIGNSTVEMEETSSGRRTTMAMQEPLP
jgi:hypothetical protein